MPGCRSRGRSTGGRKQRPRRSGSKARKFGRAGVAAPGHRGRSHVRGLQGPQGLRGHRARSGMMKR
eukprot:5081927-Lingulodinium_polyedra.AAC.1